MTQQQWKYFSDFKDQFKNKVEEWKKAAPELTELQRQAALLAKTPEYPFETTVVYNSALDDITPEDEIKLILSKLFCKSVLFTLTLVCQLSGITEL